MTTSSAMLLRKQNDFPWDVLDIIIGGKSSIETREGFSLATHDEADRFLLSYGFDLSNPIEAAETFGHFHESLNFIRKYFLAPENPEGLRIEVPRKILELTDVRDLFLYASFTAPGQQRDSLGMALKNWSCSILKVMHTIAHIDQDLRVGYFADIQKQILDRFYRLIQRDENGELYFGTGPDDELKIPLVEFQTKPKKSRDSTIIKLLHKPENVAEDIFDRVGIRFVTTKAIDALRVVKYLKDQMVVVPPNIKPSRSRNTLVDIEVFRNELTNALLLLDSGEMTEDQFNSTIEEAARPPAVSPDNPHTSEFYRSIQFTCRQLIKIRNPLYADLKDLKAAAKVDESCSEEITKLVDKIDFKNIQRDVRFFYPYEIQVVDIGNHQENERGRSAHSEYKKAQLQTAMRRVMGALENASR
jgi:uncharacterized protein (TIGR04562 family)